MLSSFWSIDRNAFFSNVINRFMVFDSWCSLRPWNYPIGGLSTPQEGVSHVIVPGNSFVREFDESYTVYGGWVSDPLGSILWVIIPQTYFLPRSCWSLRPKCRVDDLFSCCGELIGSTFLSSQVDYPSPNSSQWVGGPFSSFDLWVNDPSLGSDSGVNCPIPSRAIDFGSFPLGGS